MIDLRQSPLVVLATLVLAACAGMPEEIDDGFDRAERMRDRINQSIADNELADALNLVDGAVATGLQTSVEAQSFRRRIAVATERNYRSALLAGNYRDAITLSGNVRTIAEFIGEQSLVSDDVLGADELYLRWSRDALRRGEPVIAVATLMRRTTLGDLGEDTLLEYLEHARRLNHDEAMLRLERALTGRGAEIPPVADEVLAPSDHPAAMLAGTVTVWVNRGIRIENGLGVPDRVIGSGFFVDPRGYLLTNHHVIASEVDPEYEGFSRLYVKLPGRRDERIPARVVAWDRIFDLALLKVEIDPEYVFSLSDTRVLEPGEPVFALGSPGGLDSTITSGIVSASGRRFLQLGEAVQVDVPINPGNSGGPLVLPDGRVAGVVFAGLEQFEGVNFVIPSYWLRHFFPRMFEGGEIVHPWLGVSVHRVSRGLETIYVAPESPAGLAAIGPGQTLTMLDERHVATLAEAQDAVLGMQPGQVVVTEWLDPENRSDGRSRLLALAERPYSPVERALDRQPIEALFPVLFGMTVDEVSAAPWGPDYVITSVLPGSIADESSLSVDDPFALRTWRVDDDLRAAFIQIIIKKRKAGFLETGIQLGAFLETDSFL